MPGPGVFCGRGDEDSVETSSVGDPPMIRLRRPSPADLDLYLAGQSGQPFSYPETGRTQGEPPTGYDFLQNRAELGEGATAFAAACAAVRRWAMFDFPWVGVYPPAAPVVPGTTVAVRAHVGGLWLLNACRVVY